MAEIHLEQIRDLTKSECLLIEWGMENLIISFAEKGIDIDTFKQLTIDDINNLIPDQQFGLRIRFRTKLLEWRQLEGISLPIAETLSLNSSVSDWIAKLNVPSPISTSSFVSSEASTQKLVCSYLNLQSLLDTTTGRFIIEYYNTNNCLSNTSRQSLVNIICEHYIDHNYKLNDDLLNEAGRQINNIFPNEDLKIYLGDKSIKSRGKIDDKFYSLSKKYQNKGIISSRYKLKRKLTTSETVENDESLFIDDTELINQHIWLKQNKEPEILVIEKWKATYSLRKLQIKNKEIQIFDEWPLLTQQIGLTLVELDFDQLHPQKSHLIFSKWTSFKEKILPIFARNLKDATCIKHFQLLQTVSNDDSRNLLIFLMLHGLLVPTTIKLQQKQWKPSILDSQNAFFRLVPHKIFLESELNKLKENCASNNRTLQPLILAVGKSLEEIERVFIYLNGYYFESSSILKAISSIFQIFYALDICYPVECSQFWDFIEFFFLRNYDRKTPKSQSSITFK